MKLLVIVLCLLSERFLIHSLSYTRFLWFGGYYSFITTQLQDKPFFVNPWMMLLALVAAILLPVTLIYSMFYNLFFGFFGFLSNLFLFFYCLGPQNVFYPVYEEDIEDQNKAVEDYFITANTQMFALIFWYIIAGPIIALAYRLISLLRQFNAVSEQANQLTALLEWIPARLTALLFLLVGNFQRGFSVFKNELFSSPQTNDLILSQCGLQSVKINEFEEILMLQAQNMVELALVLLLVLIAFFTMAAWL